MKITKTAVRQFEQDQEQHGTKTAIENVLWAVAHQQLQDVGVRRTQTTYRKK